MPAEPAITGICAKLGRGSLVDAEALGARFQSIDALIARTVGEMFFADPVDGDDDNDGLLADEAKKTLQAAIDLCEANRGDVVIRMRGGEEVTTPVLFNKAGITVVSEGYGMAPLAIGEYFSTYAAAALTDEPAGIVSADGVTLCGLGFVSRDVGATFWAGAALLIGGVADASPFGVRVMNCRFPKWNLDNRIGLAIEGSSNCIIEHNDFEGVGASFDSGIYVQGATQNVEILNNRFRDCTYGILFGAFAGGGPHCVIKGNVCEDSKLLSAASAATGIVCDNWCEGATDTGSYNDTVNNLNTHGLVFSDQHYAE